MAAVQAVRERLGWVPSATLNAPATVSRGRRLTAYAFCSTNTAASHNLQVSADRGGVPLVLVGTAVPWQGWKARMRAYRDIAAAHAADAGAHADGELLLFVDAYDVVMTSTRGPEALVRAWESYGKPLVMGAEGVCMMNCKPIDAWWAAHAHDGALGDAAAATGRRFINGGFVMGTAAALAHAYGTAAAGETADDQVAMAEYFNAHPGRATLDVHRRLVWNHIARSDAPPPEPPFFTHFPGAFFDAKALLREAYEAHCGGRDVCNDKALTTSTYLGYSLIANGVLVLLLLLAVGAALRSRRAARQAREALAAAAVDAEPQLPPRTPRTPRAGRPPPTPQRADVAAEPDSPATYKPPRRRSERR